jgi:hypothetical protein
MSEALDRILPYVHAFSDGIDRCRTAVTFNPADWQDAYNRLNRLRDRYLHEKANLDASQRQAFQKVFEHDTFIEGLLNIRLIGEHVKKRTMPEIRLFTNKAIYMPVETSAGAFFASPIVRLPDSSGHLHTADHLGNLEEAEKRIQRALARASNKQP